MGQDRPSKKRLKEMAENLAKEKKVKDEASSEYRDRTATKEDREYDEWHRKHIRGEAKVPRKMRDAEKEAVTDSEVKKRYGGDGGPEPLKKGQKTGPELERERYARISEIQRKARKAAEKKKNKK